MRLKGRIWIAIWLAFAFVVLVWVVSRDTSGFMTATELSELRITHSVLQAEKAVLMRRIREGESRARLIPLAESRGFRLPADSEVVILQGVDRVRH